MQYVSVFVYQIMHLLGLFNTLFYEKCNVHRVAKFLLLLRTIYGAHIEIKYSDS